MRTNIGDQVVKEPHSIIWEGVYGEVEGKVWREVVQKCFLPAYDDTLEICNKVTL